MKVRNAHANISILAKKKFFKKKNLSFFAMRNGNFFFN